MRATILYIQGVMICFLQLTLCYGCPQDAITRVYACLHHVVGTSGEIEFLAGEDAESFNTKCLDGSFDITVQCVNNIRIQCQGSDLWENLQKTLDPVKMKETFDNACSNRNYYTESSHCVSRYKDRIHKCTSSLQPKFLKAKEEVYTTDQYLNLICSLMHGITACTEAPIRQFCDPYTAEMIVDFIAGISPVVCPSYKDGAATKTIPKWLTFFIAINLLLWALS